MNDTLFALLRVVIIAAVTIITRYAVPYIKMKIKQSNLAYVAAIVTDAVKAAEQTVKAAGAGIEKKAIVTKFLHNILTAKNISISDEQLDTLIESAVFAMKQN